MIDKSKYEILAPVGSIEMFEAALAARANAVYLAGDKFGARAYANNFSIDQLKDLVIRAHKNSIKAYLAVNTLVKDSEFEELFYYLKDLAGVGVDALIIQDIGVYKFIKENFPHFELHGSTQMTVNNYYGAKFLENLGFDRVVMGREVLLEEMKHVSQDLNIEIEAFVHGSLCVSVSGQCLISSFIGQRSGNRGRCAQPCRKVYDIYNESGKKINQVTDSYLSARDLCTLDDIKKFIDSGVYSLKIEGRMKKPEYVFSVVNQYRKALEDKSSSLDDLKMVSNRKFTKGIFAGDFGKSFYQTDQIGQGQLLGQIMHKKGIYLFTDVELYEKDIIRVITNKNKSLNLTLTSQMIERNKVNLSKYKDLKEGSEVYRIFSSKIVDDLEKNLNNNDKKEIFVEVLAYSGKALSARAYLNDKEIYIESDFTVEKAQAKPTSREEIVSAFNKFGNTDYAINELNLQMDDSIFVAKSKIKELRRLLVEALDESYRDSKKHKDLNYNKPIQEKKEKANMYFLNLEIVEKDHETLDLTYIDNVYIHDISLAKKLRERFKKNIYYVIPRITYKKDYDHIMNSIENNKEYINGISVSNYGDIEFFKDKDLEIRLEPYMNVFNSQALDFYKDRNISKITLSSELNLDELSNLSLNEIDAEIIGYGRINQMLLKQCPAAIIKGCKDDSMCSSCQFRKGIYLKNKQDKLPLRRHYGYTEVLSEEAINILGIKKDIDKLQVRNIRLIYRGEKDFNKTLENYIKVYKKLELINTKEKYYTGHLKLGVI